MCNREVTVTIAIVIVILSALLITRVGSEFVPSLNEGDIALHAIRIPGTSLTTAIEMQNKLEETIKIFPEVEIVFSKIGTAEIATDPMPPSGADVFIKPQSKWTGEYRTKAELISAMEQVVQRVPGNNYEFTQPVQMRFNELISGVRADVAVKVFGNDMDALLALGEEIEHLLAAVSGAADVRTEQITGLPVISIQMDRSRMARYGLNGRDVQDVVAMSVGGRNAGMIFEGDRRFDLQIRLPEHLRTDIEALKRLPITIPVQSMAVTPITAQALQPTVPAFVTLEEVADFEITQGPNQVSRKNGKHRIVITANVRGRDLGSFVNESEQLISEKISIPPGYWIIWGGQFEQMISAMHRLQIVIPVAFGLIFILLYNMFGNMRDGLLMFTGVPFALIGGIFALWLRDIPLSISAGVGFIALSGMAVLNGLVMLAFIRGLREEGLLLDDAIQTGALTRLRPVLMTALVASIGFLPMAISTGTGRSAATSSNSSNRWYFIIDYVKLLVLPVLYRMVHGKNSTGI